MKLLSKRMARLLLGAALTLQFASISYAMDGTGDGWGDGAPVAARLPCEILAACRTFTMDGAERASQEIAGFFRAKENESGRKIKALEIDRLEAEYKAALGEARRTAEIDDSFNLVGDVPADAATFLAQMQEGQKKKNLFEIAQLQSEVFQREAVEARELFEFFGTSTAPLGTLVQLKDFIISAEVLWSVGYNHMLIGPRFRDMTALALMAGVRDGVLFLDVENAEFKRLTSHPRSADILRLLGDLPARTLRIQDSVNKWFSDFPQIWDVTFKGLQQAHIQQSVTVDMYGSSELAGLDAKGVAAHRKKLLSLSKIIEEKQSVINVMSTFKEFLNLTKEYLRKNSKLS